MSYQVLARKWRPRQFSELVGQQHVKTALANALNSARLHHAYLFTGTRGVGKTTIARIFAKSLNCETGITATPCGQCSTCLEIDGGNYVDLMEIDAASRTKVEDTRDLLDNVQYAPSRGRYKVYLIDEVHMLSRHSFNALLKTLEEPPPHVKFLLATTDPQKLPVTVLSRCLQFSLKALTVGQIQQHLAAVLSAEDLPFDESALQLLAKAAKGSLRDSLSLTDQAIALGNGEVRLQPVREMLGLLDTSWAVQLLQSLLTADLAALQHSLQQLLSQQADYLQVLDDVLSLLHLTALSQLQPALAEHSDYPDAVRHFAASQSPEAIQLYYQLLLSGKKDLPYAPEPAIGLEMALLRTLAFVPAAQGGQPPVLTENKALSPQRPATESSVVTTVAPTPVQPAPPTAAEPLTSVMPPDTNPATPLQPQPAAVIADTAVVTSTDEVLTPATAAIDPVTARIMARRGVVVPGTLAAQETAAKKSERQAAPESNPITNTAAGSAATQAIGQLAAVLKPQQPQPQPQQHAQPEPDNWLPSDVEYAAPVEVNAGADLRSADGSESQQAAYYAQQDEQADAQFADDADTQAALSEGWWQAQHFDSLPAADSDVLDEQRFSIRFAAQVDAWARLIEQLELGGLLRLYLLNSALSQQEQQVLLTVARHQQHLDNPTFRSKVYQAIAPVFAPGFQLDIQYQEEVPTSPLAIQQRIEQERKDYVSRLLQQDPHIQAIQLRFAAELQLDTLEVN
ncbi:DNA polymerase III subunit gamma/tau [Alishewanella jeotgali]|uniref:DNA polymerase III subunit gamma/tau n=1 Tax=Alishewanella jeotgali KCTC 22429 TaxID=1129374 RepID=H3ZHH6_9ALTE|nr:DNA polymerase III subunit gamma/tau [Alishewanella jeotgali]EHR39832.1 DNA polymerase III subunits gamma/tau [Alishewanella jeotgali KCTC 22429]